MKARHDVVVDRSRLTHESGDRDMSEKIYVDVSQPATLRYGSKLIDCPTLDEAVLAFDRLPEGDREQATVKVDVPGGATYTAEEIDRLHVAHARRGVGQLNTRAASSNSKRA
jgi:hypothetical protein